MRRLLALTLLIVSGAAVLPAAAAPVDTTRVGEVRLRVQAADGSHVRLTVSASHAAVGDALDVVAAICHQTCGVEQHYSGALPAGALTLDPAQASGQLRTSLGGVAFTVFWSPEPGVGAQKGHADDSSVGTYNSQPATAKARMSTRGCEGAATVGSQIDVTLTRPAGGYQPLSHLRLPARPAALVCAG